MDTIYMNSQNRLLLNISDKINLNSCGKYLAQSIS